MKKDYKISDIVKKRNDIAELLIIEQNQYMPFLKELQKQADELNTITEKIHFWENEKQKYLNGIDSYTFASSGIVSLNMPANTELFLDKEITKEINKLKALIPPQQTETKTDKLKAELGKYGFFELPKVRQLSEPNKQSLVELISTNDLPYSIAMIEYLGFIKHLKAEYFKTDNKLFNAVANWFEVAERAVKGNIYVLNEFSNENRTRYTADQQKQKVQKNYEALK